MARWAKGAIGHADENADLVAAINAALELRRQRATLAAKERAFVASLAG